MSVKDDIAKADKITELDGKIDELEKEIAAIVEKYKTLRLRLESEMDTKIKTLFQEKVNDPSLKVIKSDDVIVAKYASLEYRLEIGSSSTNSMIWHRRIFRKLDFTTHAYEFRYTFPSLPERRRFVSIAGCSNEIERKQTELKSLEEYLLKHQKTLQEFEKQGIKLEYAQLDANTYNAPSDAFQGIGIEPLLSFIFG